MLHPGFSEQMASFVPFESSPHLAVAVSGGSDSMALVLLAHEWATQHRGKVTALTVNHGFRKEAQQEAEQVSQWLSAHSIEHHILSHQRPLPTSNIQEWARKLRYELMTEWCETHNVLHLLVGHQQDDQIETFFLRLMRGSGVDGLAAMSTLSRYHNTRLLRPLLGYTREALRAFLSEKQQSWVDDPSNDNNDFSRNKLRHALRAIEGDEWPERTVNTIDSIAETRLFLEQESAEAMVRSVTLHREGYADITYSIWLNCSKEIQLRILASVLMAVSGAATRPRFEKLERLHTSLQEEHFSGATLYGCKLLPLDNDGVLRIIREQKPIEKEVLLSPDGQEYRWDNRFIVSHRSPIKQMLHIGALGAEGVAFLKKHDTPLPLPHQIMLTLPAFQYLFDGKLEKLLAVPHISFYASDMSEASFQCDYSPPRPLTTLPFGHKVGHRYSRP